MSEREDGKAVLDRFLGLQRTDISTHDKLLEAAYYPKRCAVYIRDLAAQSHFDRSVNFGRDFFQPCACQPHHIFVVGHLHDLTYHHLLSRTFDLPRRHVIVRSLDLLRLHLFIHCPDLPRKHLVRSLDLPCRHIIFRRLDLL